MPWLHNPFSRPSKPDPEADASSSEAEPHLPAPTSSSSSDAVVSASPPGSPPSSSAEQQQQQPAPPPEELLESFPDSPDSPPPRPSQDIGAILAHLKTPTPHLSGHQIFYIFVIDGLGAGILSGGINFAVAYAMYTTQDTTLHPIRLFRLPNTLAGDAAVTIILQSLITWFIEFFLVRRDLSAGGVSPIGFFRRPRHLMLRRLFLLDEYSLPTTNNANPGAGAGAGGGGRWWTVVRWILEQAARAMLTAVVGFVLFWPVSVGVLTAFGRREGGDWVYEKTWTPQVFKLVLGGGWGLVQTPVYAGFWLIREGWVLMGPDGESDTEAVVAADGDGEDVVDEGAVGDGAAVLPDETARVAVRGNKRAAKVSAVGSPTVSDRAAADEVAVVSDEEG